MANFGPNNDRLRAMLDGLLKADFGDDQSVAAAKLGVSQSMISLALSDAKPVGPKLLKGLARYTKLTLDELAGEAANPRWRNLPGWAAEESAARKLFPRVRGTAFDAIGNLMGERPPTVSALAIGLLASTWDQVATDDQRVEAIRENALREMAAEDAEALVTIKRRHEAKERGETPPPMPGEPREAKVKVREAAEKKAKKGGR